MKQLRRTSSAAAGNGLGNTINKHSPAMQNERRRGQRPGHHDQVSAIHNERRRGQRPGATIKYLRCTTSGTEGNGLGTTIKLLRAAADIDLGTTIKYQRRATSAAANNGLGTTIKYLVNQNTGAGSNWAKAHIIKKLGTNSNEPPCTVAAFVVKARAFSMCSLAPHTSGPRDVPRCGALSLLQKPLQYRGGPAETAATLNVKWRTSVVTGGAWSRAAPYLA
jgi:hypothetical protein